MGNRMDRGGKGRGRNILFLRRGFTRWSPFLPWANKKKLNQSSWDFKQFYRDGGRGRKRERTTYFLGDFLAFRTALPFEGVFFSGPQPPPPPKNVQPVVFPVFWRLRGFKRGGGGASLDGTKPPNRSGGKKNPFFTDGEKKKNSR